MAGYSPTPQVRKLGIKPGHVVVLDRSPHGWQLDDPPSVTLTDAAHSADVVLAFTRDLPDVGDAVDRLAGAVRPAGSLWLLWPRKAAGHVSTVSENAIRETALAAGLVDVKVAAVDDDWSGLKLVWRKENR